MIKLNIPKLGIILLLLSCNKSKLSSFPKVNEEPKPIDSTVLFDTLDSSLLIYLIKNSTLDNFKNAIWQPQTNEIDQFPVSYDGNCHTSLDTVLLFKTFDASTKAVVILRTYQFSKDNTKYGSHYKGSPAGVAIYKRNLQNKWQLEIFDKHLFSLGYYVGAEQRYKGVINLLKMSNSTFLYCRQNEGGQQGYTEGFEMLYTLENRMKDGSEKELLKQVFFNDYTCTYFRLLEENNKTDLK